MTAPRNKFDDIPWSDLGWRERGLMVVGGVLLTLLTAVICLGIAAFCLIPFAILALFGSLAWRIAT